MTLSLELCKKLEAAGFPKREGIKCKDTVSSENQDINPGWKTANDVYEPDMEELIEACGENLKGLQREENGWEACSDWGHDHQLEGEFYGDTPEIAVANLWLSINAPSHSPPQRP